jgi:hypothetical protein
VINSNLEPEVVESVDGFMNVSVSGQLPASRTTTSAEAALGGFAMYDSRELLNFLSVCRDCLVRLR